MSLQLESVVHVEARAPALSSGRRAAGREATGRYLAVLFGAVDEDSLIEVRFRADEGMRRRFFAAGRPGSVVDAILALSSGTDVFLGVLPRLRRRGRREDIVAEGRLAWADCDTAAASAALGSFVPGPSMIVASGSDRHRHAYWLLRRPLDLDTIERLNHRLALALGADTGAVTRATAILRPPGTVNLKHSPPAPVRLVGLREDRRVDPAELERGLPPEPASAGSSRPLCPPGPRTAGDPLLAIPPAVYFERLLGRPVGRSPKLHCPFHDDRTPSLHVYEDPARGWYCFGCGRGGSIYDLAALLWGRRTAGRDFVELRRELRRRFG